MTKLIHFLVISIFFAACQPDERITYCDVLVVGEGTGAVAAAIQSARSGAATILVNPQPWLGGMMTSAGVSAIDGNHQLPAGLWGEFRQHLRDHYGGPAALATGWVSHTQYEPHVGAMYWQQMADNEPLLIIRKNALWSKVEKKKYWIVEVILENGETEKIKARMLVDGTDLGDVAAAAGATFDLGMDARNNTGEAMAPAQANDIVQDLTYAAILKNFGDSADMTIPPPPGYDPSLFYCSCELEAEKLETNLLLPPDFSCGEEKPHPCLTMLTYGKLPNDKYMINWPRHGNDFYANVSEMSPPERVAVFQKAKEKTLGFVYYIQHELGFNNLGLADDEFPTNDQMALMPYHREGRRIHGLVQMTVNHILYPYNTNLYRTGIAVGDYPIDHHHAENEHAPEIDFPKVPSFNIPLGCLIPKNVDGLLIADKAISVTNIVNGSSRLQPVIIQVGQAAGLMAAMADKQNISPNALDVREIQGQLVEANGYLMPFIDVPPNHPYFATIQRIGATGILKGRGVPYQWANQTWFDVDSTISSTELVKGLQSYENSFKFEGDFSEDKLSILQAVAIIESYANQMLDKGDPMTFEDLIDIAKDNWETGFGLDNYEENRSITKGELAVLLEKIINPFENKVDFNGQLINSKK